MEQPQQNSSTPIIDWNPLVSGGANFKTHKLTKISKQRMEYKASLASKLFASIFIVIGIGVASTMFVSDAPMWVSGMGLLFFGIGVLTLKRAFTPIVFDKTEGYFWKGKKRSQEVDDISKINTIAKLDEIYGIQVIKEHVKSRSSKGRDTSYYSYEINLVLNSGKRLNVVDYGNANSILQDASTLSKFINKRVLTASE